MLKAKHGFSFIVAAVFVLLIVACGDNDSDFATRPSEGSSSSVTPQSSSSEKAESSSSKVTEPAEVTSGTMTDSRDGQTYKTVTIGTQTWMAQNLNYAYTDVPYKSGDNTSDSTSWCYKDDANNCSKYGRLYTWAAAMDSVGTWSTNGKGCGYYKKCSPTYPVRGVCPEGWHLPTKAEFETLFTAVGGQSTAGEVLKSATGWTAYGGITNEYAFAFSALPAGLRGLSGGYKFEGGLAYFWSSTENSSDNAYYMDLYDSLGYAYLDNGGKNYGFSVRCLKDEGETVQSSSSVTPQSSDSETSVSTGTMTDSRDGQTYKTVTIGTQTWMAENLNYETANSYCYKDSASYCTKYGRLYTWEAATTACPDGWHLPTKAEFETLFTAVGGQSTAGKVLKSTSGWSGNGSDAFAFSALPAGFRYGDGLYYHEGYYAYFWSSTEYYSDSAYNMYLYHNYESANVINDKYYGFSVRCLKDDGSTTQSSSSSAESSSSVTLATPCKTETEDNCEYGELTDSRDGQTYKTVTIGTQTWMAQNLNYAYTDVPYKSGDNTSDSTSWCYKDDANNCSKYGRLYTWAAAMDSVGIWSTNGKGCGYNKTSSPTYPVRGVCPEGWHLPTEEEFETLFRAVGGQSTAGKVLKSTSGWDSSGNGSDAFAFSALPTAFRGSNGNYLYEGYGAYFWSSTEDGSYYAYYMALRYGNDDAYLDGNNELNGFSVRCLKD